MSEVMTEEVVTSPKSLKKPLRVLTKRGKRVATTTTAFDSSEEDVLVFEIGPKKRAGVAKTKTTI